MHDVILLSLYKDKKELYNVFIKMLISKKYNKH